MNTDPKLAEQAARWIRTLRQGDARDQAAFGAWLKESPKHIEEALCATAVDEALERLEPSQWPDISGFLANPGATVIPLQDAAPGPAHAAPRPRLRIWGIAAGLACAIGAAWMWNAAGWQPYSTAVGEQRTFTLEDGSLAYVNTDSKVDVKFTGTAREIRVLKGEALFKVQHEASRPFSVRSDAAVIRALGTQFNVYRSPRGTVVAVLEGLVEVSVPGGSTRLGANQAARVTADTVTEGDRIDVARASAWRQRRLVFEGAPLPEVAEEFNRYNREPRIRIVGKTAAAKRFTGAFDADDPASLIALLATYEDLQVRRSADEIVIGN